MKINNNFILSFCVLGLVLLCFFSIYSPIGFEKEQAKRETVVRERMKTIQKAEQIYLQRHSVYTGNLQNLIREGLLADSLQYIPYSEGQRFRLQATMELTKSGRQIPRLRCQAGYADYLRGLDAEQLAALTEEANRKGNFPGIEINN